MPPLSPNNRGILFNTNKLIGMKTDKSHFDHENHSKYFQDYFGMKDRGKRQLPDFATFVKEKNFRDFNIVSNIVTS